MMMGSASSVEISALRIGMMRKLWELADIISWLWFDLETISNLPPSRIYTVGLLNFEKLTRNYR